MNNLDKWNNNLDKWCEKGIHLWIISLDGNPSSCIHCKVKYSDYYPK